jgi:phosphatidylserine/phosphatidylglycerophosphate/cardiolipin synthase-like enzyme
MGIVENRGMMHSKAAVIDSELVYVGSANVSKSGLLYSREAGVIFKSKPVAAQLLEIFNADLNNPFCLDAKSAVKHRYSYSRCKEARESENIIYFRKSSATNKIDAIIVYSPANQKFKKYDYQVK